MIEPLTGNPIIDYGFLAIIIYGCICSFVQLFIIWRKIWKKHKGDQHGNEMV